MTVQELKEIISDLPNEMEVIIQKDAGGNGYSPAAYADPDCVYVPDGTYFGEVYSTKWSAKDASMEEYEWDQIKSRPKALVLAPTY